jgi:hypothetical protein
MYIANSTMEAFDIKHDVLLQKTLYGGIHVAVHRYSLRLEGTISITLGLQCVSSIWMCA